MDVRFDAAAAQTLIDSMCTYCSSIQKDAKDVLKLLDSGKEWNDPQFQTFSEAVRQICSDLDKTLKLESDYLTVYQERVNELRS